MVPKGTIISAQSKKEQTRSDDGSISRRLALLRQSRSLTLPRQSRSLTTPSVPQSRPLPSVPQARPTPSVPQSHPTLAFPQSRPTLSFPQFLAGIHGKAQKPATIEHLTEGEKTLASRLHGNNMGGKRKGRSESSQDTTMTIPARSFIVTLPHPSACIPVRFVVWPASLRPLARSEGRQSRTPLPRRTILRWETHTAWAESKKSRHPTASPRPLNGFID